MFTFIESTAFERVRPVYLDDDEYAELQQFMIGNPTVGAVIPGSGGVREVALAARGYGQAWRCASNLFRTLSAQRILDANLVCQG